MQFKGAATDVYYFIQGVILLKIWYYILLSLLLFSPFRAVESFEINQTFLFLFLEQYGTDKRLCADESGGGGMCSDINLAKFIYINAYMSKLSQCAKKRSSTETYCPGQQHIFCLGLLGWKHAIKHESHQLTTLNKTLLYFSNSIKRVNAANELI